MNIIIEKLFGERNYDLQFNNKLNVIVGENGCGKSTILQIINYIFNHDFIKLSELQFDQIIISFGKKELCIKHNDLFQIPFTANPDFRELLFKTLLENKFNNFSDFYDYLFVESNNFNYYNTISYNTFEYVTNVEKYLKDDLKYIPDDDYFAYMIKYKVHYGSKIYLENIFNYFKKENISTNIFNNFCSCNFYSFIDLETKNINYNVNINSKVIETLSKYMHDKIISVNNGEINVKDKKTNVELKNSKLSSGEKKLIKIINVCMNCDKETILLLDEPELSLSIFWQRKLIEDLLSICPSGMILIATQSTNLLESNELQYLVPIIYEEVAHNE